MDNTDANDSRRTKLMARRYHVTVRTGEGLDDLRTGEFFYDSLREARAFIRAQYREFNSGWGFGDDFTAQDWKEVWAVGGLSITVQEDGCEDSHFDARLIDTQATVKKEYCPVTIWCDLRAESQERFADEALAQAEEGAR